MIRFIWLQFRTQAAVTLGALAALAIVLAITGPHLTDLYNTTVLTCQTNHDCNTATTTFSNADGALEVISSLLVIVVPALLGMFWGAPLIAREFESGTFRLAWTQGITRTRWLATKLGIGVLASVVVTGLLSLMVTWWSSKLDLVGADRFNKLLFSARDVVPIGYAAFAFVLGFTAGLIMRRTVPAMFVALVCFVAARMAVVYWISPHLMTPSHKIIAINGAAQLGLGQSPHGVVFNTQTKGIISNAWVYSNRVVNNAGHPPSVTFLRKACPFNSTTGEFNVPSCLTNLSAKFHEVVTYQPSIHYWPIQWYEMGIFAGFAVVLGGISLWWVRHSST